VAGHTDSEAADFAVNLAPGVHRCKLIRSRLHDRPHRLRTPTRKKTCTASHSHHAAAPATFTRLKSATGSPQSELLGEPAPRLGFNGCYVEGGWAMTGEPIPYDTERAAWGGLKVDHPFTLGDGAVGAWELSARYSTADLDSNVIPGVAQSVTGGVYGGQQQIAALALSWYPNHWLRFTLQFQYVDVNKLNSAGTVQIGQRFETLAARAQAAW
jgi:hypothetical protein